MSGVELAVAFVDGAAFGISVMLVFTVKVVLRRLVQTSADPEQMRRFMDEAHARAMRRAAK